MLRGCPSLHLEQVIDHAQDKNIEANDNYSSTGTSDVGEGTSSCRG